MSSAGRRDGRRDGPAVEGRLRIALVAPPMEPVPPVAYGGTERIVDALAVGLGRLGHEVTVYASGDSSVPGELRATVPAALWRTGYRGDVSAYMLETVARCWAEAARYDLVHSHVEGYGFPFARHAPVPVLTTLHGRLDQAGMPELLRTYRDVPLVAISHSQRSFAPGANWQRVIHHGLDLAGMPFRERPGDYLLFVGRVAPEKGVADALELARRVDLPIRVAAKVHSATEREHFDQVLAPLAGRPGVEFLGELPPAERNALFAGARATLMLGSWPEPFGLVAIESLAAGTPVIARPGGALPEIVADGIDGFVVDEIGDAVDAVRRVPGLDRVRIRERALARFSLQRMVDDYVTVYRALLERGAAGPPSAGPLPQVLQVRREGRVGALQRALEITDEQLERPIHGDLDGPVDELQKPPIVVSGQVLAGLGRSEVDRDPPESVHEARPRPDRS